MQHYELLFIVSLKLNEVERQKLFEKITSVATACGMTITVSKEVGKRRLAYPIKKESQGVYHLIEFNGEQSEVKKFDRELRLTSAILRFVILTKRVKTAEELDREMRLRERIEGRRREAEQAALAKEREATREAVQKTEGAKPESTKKISLEDLDKKLDEILKEDV